MSVHCEMQDERAELLADPERSVAIDDQRLWIEVRAGQLAAWRRVVDDPETRSTIGIRELDEPRIDVHLSRFPARTHAIDPQEKIIGVGFRPVPVVRQREPPSRVHAIRHDRREPLNRL